MTARLLMQAMAGGGGGGDVDAFLEKLRPVLRALAAEYGLMDCEVLPHTLESSPATFYREVAAGAAVELDVTQALGKESTRGHVANVGDAECIVDWVPYNSAAYVGEYHLPPGAVLDTSSWIVRKLRIRAPSSGGPVAVQTLHQ